MDFETFAKGMAFLSEAFPRREFNTKFYFQRLKDLSGEDFEKAVLDVVDNMVELYPDSNLIAILRAKTNDFSKRRIEKITKLPDLRSDPPPKEWSELVKSATPKVSQ